MKKPVNRDVDGQTYEFYLMGPKDQIKVMNYMARTVGKPLGAAIKNDPSSAADILDTSASMIGDFITHLVESVDDDEVIAKIEKILEYVHIKKEKGFAPVKMEADFHGKLSHMFKVVYAALEVNFGDFLAGNGVLVERLKQKFQTMSAKS
jgi:hypothetical protein